MSSRRLSALALLLAALAAAASWTVLRSGRVERRKPLAGFKAESAARLLIERGGDPLELEKAAGRWRLVRPVADLADAAAVEEIVTGLTHLTLGSEVSRDPESYPAFDIAEASATRLRLYAAGEAVPVLDGYFGKDALGYDSMYFRAAREKPVLLASGFGSFRLKRPAAEFRERALFGFKDGELRAARLEAGGKSYELARATAGWASTAAGLSGEKGGALIGVLLALRASDFAEGTPAHGFDKPLLRATLSTGVREERLTVGAWKPAPGAKPTLRYARIEGREAILLVPGSDLDALASSLRR